jgi:hypothetical protein
MMADADITAAKAAVATLFLMPNLLDACLNAGRLDLLLGM